MKLASHIRASEIPNLILPNSFPTPLTPTSDLESDSANVVVDVIDSDERVVFDEVADDEVVDVASNKSLSPILSLKFSVDDDQKSYITGNGMIDTGTVDNFVVLLLKTHQFQYQTCALSQPGAVFRPIDKSLPNYQILHLHTRSHFVLTTQQVDGTVFIYDSLPRDSSSIDSNCELYCKITRLYPDFSHLVLYCPQRQEGYVDCGIFCLANLFEILLGNDPHAINFDQASFRKILLKCMNDEKLYRFPSSKKLGRKRATTAVTLTVHKTIDSVKKLEHVVFHAGCGEKGRPKKQKQRHFTPSFNKK